MTTLLVALVISTPPRLEARWSHPARLPFPRVHALEKVGEEFFVAGIEGLARGKPGSWRKVEDRPIRDMVRAKDVLWVLYGDGSVDKLEPRSNRLFYDVLHEAAKRPWASTLVSSESAVVFGGHGGWMSRGEKFSETYPAELKDQVVTAVWPMKDAVWIGTQKKGLFRFQGKKATRFGFAAGLPDTWITSLVSSGSSVTVGLADGGVVQIKDGKVVPMPCPVQKVRKLLHWSGKLVVGGMEGTYLREGTEWRQLSGEECTYLGVVEGRLVVGSPTGVAWWQS